MVESATDWDSLLTLSHSWAHLASCTERTFSNLFRILNLRSSGIVARRIRGRFSRNSPDFFRESAAALQFPYYFGHNWDAFDECINDLGWLPAKHYVIGISHSNLLLTRDEKRLTTLIDILRGAANAWPTHEKDRDWTKTWVFAEDGTRQWDQRTIASFHVIFHCEQEDESMTCDRLQRSGLSVAPLRISPEFHAL